jgi:hypothetical protein
MTATQDRELRRTLHGTLGSLPPSPVPIEAIIRRGKGIRLRRAGVAVGVLALAAIAGATLAPAASRQPAVPATAPAAPSPPDGVFARGIAGGHAWRLAVQDIADPGYPCQPAIVLNGTDADPVYPAPGNLAAVALGPALPGIGFGFMQLPATVSRVVVNGQANVPAVTVTACGLSYHVAGFTYPLATAAQVTVPNPPAGWPSTFTVPQVSVEPPSTATTPENPGLWINAYPAGGGTAPGILDAQLVYGPDWSMQVQFGTGGDCYAFSMPGSTGSAQMGYCGPVSTPDGPETIMALPLANPSYPATAATGYAVQVSPVTARLKATLSNGSSELAAFCVVDGRRYAVFVVRDPLRLSRLTWLDARGRIIASTTALPRYGYVQFQP